MPQRREKYAQKEIESVATARSVCPAGNYGNQIDGINKPSSAKSKKKDGENDEEESELIQNSSDDDADEDGYLASVSSTPLMKPVITDRSGVRFIVKKKKKNKSSKQIRSCCFGDSTCHLNFT